MLHRWNAIGIASNQNNTLNRSLLREGRHIQTNPHIDPFLLKIGSEVLVAYRLGG